MRLRNRSVWRRWIPVVGVVALLWSAKCIWHSEPAVESPAANSTFDLDGNDSPVLSDHQAERHDGDADLNNPQSVAETAVEGLKSDVPEQSALTAGAAASEKEHGVISGSVRARSGGQIDGLKIVLMSQDAPSKRLPLSMVREGGAYAYTFEAHVDVSLKHSIAVNCARLVEWSPSSVIEVITGNVVEFMCEDVGGFFKLRFTLIDAASGRIVDCARVYASAVSGDRLEGKLATCIAPGSSSGISVSEGLGFYWVCNAHGYIPVEGGASDYWSLGGDFGDKPAIVRVTQGWGLLLIVRRNLTMEPLADVAVRLDGKVCAVTDKYGRALLQGAYPPASIELVVDQMVIDANAIREVSGPIANFYIL